MGRSNQSNTLLVEIMIAVLIFAGCATVVLDAFVITRNQSRQAGIYNNALTEAQNIADRLYVFGDFAATLEEAGFEQDEQGWTREEAEYTMRVTASQEERDAGVMLSAEVRAYERDEVLFTLPCLRYIPGEVQP